MLCELLESLFAVECRIATESISRFEINTAAFLHTDHNEILYTHFSPSRRRQWNLSQTANVLPLLTSDMYQRRAKIGPYLGPKIPAMTRQYSSGPL